MIAKGCWSDTHEPDSLKSVNPTDAHRRSYNLSDVKLSTFDENGNRKNIHGCYLLYLFHFYQVQICAGLGYFCKPTKKDDKWEPDFCNSATIPTVSLVGVLIAALTTMRFV